MRIRASLGTLAALGMSQVRVAAESTTAYLMQAREVGCLGSCAFCPQSRVSKSPRDLLSRVEWPEVELEELAGRLASDPGPIRRVCLQTVLADGFEEESLKIISTLREAGVRLPASVAITPVEEGLLQEFRKLGVTHVGVGLDAATPELVERVGKPFSWGEYWDFAELVVKVFGPRRALIHLIFGLGETEEEFVRAMAKAYQANADVALFAFTPVPGTPMASNPPPDLEAYRRMQAARHLLSRGASLDEVLERLGKGDLRPPPEATVTSGCPWCNRPFYNERPSGPIYNFPSLEMALSAEGEGT